MEIFCLVVIRRFMGWIIVPKSLLRKSRSFSFLSLLRSIIRLLGCLQGRAMEILLANSQSSSHQKAITCQYHQRNIKMRAPSTDNYGNPTATSPFPDPLPPLVTVPRTSVNTSDSLPSFNSIISHRSVVIRCISLQNSRHVLQFLDIPLLQHQKSIVLGVANNFKRLDTGKHFEYS